MVVFIFVLKVVFVHSCVYGVFVFFVIFFICVSVVF